MSHITTQKELHTMPLSVRNLTVTYHNKPVLWNIDLQIDYHGIIAIVGPNGAGKSTFIKAALELIPRLSGEILFYGKKYQEQQQTIAYVPQRESVDWHYPITAIELVCMGLYGTLGWCRRVNKAAKQKALQALEQVGMAEYKDRQISQLSGGQQQRLFLARALVQDADIYFMDEPFVGVDIATEKSIVALLHQLKDNNKTVFVVHHALETVTEYFDYVIMLNMRLIAHGLLTDAFTQENLQKTYSGRLTLLDKAFTNMTQHRSL